MIPEDGGKWSQGHKEDSILTKIHSWREAVIDPMKTPRKAEAQQAFLGGSQILKEPAPMNAYQKALVNAFYHAWKVQNRSPEDVEST